MAFRVDAASVETRVNLARTLMRHAQRTLVDEEAVRILTRTKLQDGRLPSARALRVHGRPGDGETCDACETAIVKKQMLIEVLTTYQTPSQLHANCFQIWETERQKLP